LKTSAAKPVKKPTSKDASGRGVSRARKESRSTSEARKESGARSASKVANESRARGLSKAPKEAKPRIDTPAGEVNPARALAVRILCSRGEGVEAALARTLDRSSLSAEDRRLLAETVLGTTRMQRHLDGRLDRILGARARRLAPRLRVILRAAAYQLLFLDRIPAYAAVNEAVTLARREGHEGWASLANAVLRKITREPLRIEETGDDSIAALGIELSYPDWIVRRVAALLGLGDARAFLEAGNRPHPVTLRTNTLRISRDDLIARLAQGGIAAERCAIAPRGIRLAGGAFAPSLDILREGLASVQDESAIIVSDLVAPRAGETIADLCASPGGKSLAIAEAGGAGVRVIAIDRPSRMRRLRENLARLAWTDEGGGEWTHRSREGPRISLIEGDARTLEAVACDAVLVDAPCTGLGVLSRHAELRWERRESDVARLAGAQLELLDAAASWVRPGGRLVYSTCSILPEENEAIVRAFLERHQEFRVEPPPRDIQDALGSAHSTESQDAFGLASASVRTWPHRHGLDGAFAVLLRKASS
jgi:16S rRNA (cytosine967-C5)-methyltransferase